MVRQARSNFMKVRAIHLGRDANELVQAGGRLGQGGGPQQARQQALEALSAEPLPLRHVLCGNQVKAVWLIGLRERAGVFLVKGRQGFDRPLVSAFGPMHRSADVKAIEMVSSQKVGGF